MAVFCPYKADMVLYPECLECEDRGCCSTGTVFALLVVGNCPLSHKATAYDYLDKVLDSVRDTYEHILIVVEGEMSTILNAYAKERGYLFKRIDAMSQGDTFTLIARYENRRCLVFSNKNDECRIEKKEI